MNIIPATVVESASGLAIELLGTRIPVARRHHPALEGLKRVEVGIRPQALRLVPVGPDRTIGRVFLREPLGLEDEILVEVGEGTRVKVVTTANEEFPESAQVGLDVRPADLYLFSSASKATICSGID
jgi:ABC-type sugar transport system ATPase subunit